MQGKLQTASASQVQAECKCKVQGKCKVQVQAHRQTRYRAKSRAILSNGHMTMSHGHVIVSGSDPRFLWIMHNEN